MGGWTERIQKILDCSAGYAKESGLSGLEEGPPRTMAVLSKVFECLTRKSIAPPYVYKLHI
jgi:hypothetical protein